MEEGQKIKKVSMGYLLSYILGPCVFLVLCGVLSFRSIEDPGVAAMVMAAALMLAVFWWSFLGTALYDRSQPKRLRALEDRGFIRNHTFTGDGCTVAVDLVHGNLAMMFRWDPAQTYIVPASRITKVWADDGRGGPGILEGTSRVSFLFTVDGVTVRVNTFTSNRRWRMDSGNVLTGISKADVMVEVLERAREGAA